MHQEMLNEQYWAEAPPFPAFGNLNRTFVTED
jgi:hypothetical protein